MFGKFRFRRKVAGLIIFAGFLLYGFSGWYAGDVASWYGPGHYGSYTASGNVLDANDWTAASWDYPFGRKLKVCSEYACARGVVVTDRGPAARTGRTIDLNMPVAERIGIIEAGEAPVTVYDTGNHDPRYLTR
jgi:rare lipoprotein A